jgi:hypothetical protein
VTNAHDNVKRRLSMPGIALRSIALALAVVAAAIGTGTVRAASGAYIGNPLVSDGGTTAPTNDTSLVNGWGLSAGPTTPWWASDNGTSLSTLYSGTGALAFGNGSAAGPTGTLYFLAGPSGERHGLFGSITTG